MDWQFGFVFRHEHADYCPGLVGLRAHLVGHRSRMGDVIVYVAVGDFFSLWWRFGGSPTLAARHCLGSSTQLRGDVGDGNDHIQR